MEEEEEEEDKEEETIQMNLRKISTYRYNFSSHVLYCNICNIYQHYTTRKAAQWHRVASASSDILHSSKNLQQSSAYCRPLADFKKAYM